MTDSWPAPKPAITITRAILLDSFPTLSASSEMPAKRAKEFFVIGMANAFYPNPAITVPRPLIECWSTTAELAEQLACRAIQVMRNAKGYFEGEQSDGSTVGAWAKGMRDIQGPFPLNDPDIQDRRRFQFHGDLYLSTS